MDINGIKETFPLGAIVELKSGGERMVVCEIDENTLQVKLVYMYEGKINKVTCHPDVLRVIKKN